MDMTVGRGLTIELNIAMIFKFCHIGGTPYPTMTGQELLRFLRAGNRMKKPENCSDEMYVIDIGPTLTLLAPFQGATCTYFLCLYKHANIHRHVQIDTFILMCILM